MDDLSALTADPELAAMFIAETHDHLGSIETTLLQLERDLLHNEAAPMDARLLDDLFRPFHTIKGNAGTLGVRSIQDVAHSVEDLLDAARAGRVQLGLEDVELILRAVDLLSTTVTEVGRRLAGQEGTNLDAITMQLTDALYCRAIGSGPDRGALREERSAHRGVGDAAAGAAGAEAGHSVKIDMRKLDGLVETVGLLMTAQSRLRQNAALKAIEDEGLAWQLAQLRRLARDVHRNVMELRLVPVRQTFQRMVRLVRDLSRSSGKPAELVLDGEDTEIDRKMVEEIADPLMHLLRNSVDHGIEDPETRQRLGKPLPARLALHAHQEPGRIVITVSDDGAGLDRDRILEKAIAGGLVEPEQPLTDEEIHALIFRPGFSTAEQITTLSGRGVGMDVVARNVEALNGEIAIETARGEGTTFVLKLPLTLAILGASIVKVGHERFVISMAAFVESQPSASVPVVDVRGAPFAQLQDGPIPLLSLRDLFGIPAGDAGEGAIVVAADGQRRVALLVDELVGRQEVLVKSLDRMMEQVRFICSTADLADGRIGMVLDVPALIAAADQAASTAAA